MPVLALDVGKCVGPAVDEDRTDFPLGDAVI
jgi:hypothetical protein